MINLFKTDDKGNRDYLYYENVISLKDFIFSQEYKNLKEIAQKDEQYFNEVVFYRNPIRQTRNNKNYLKAYADGILLYQGKFKANEKILNIKGNKLTVKEILCDDTINKDKKFYVFGTYLTTYSVHIVRNPYNGIVVDIEYLPPLTSYNLPMVLFENNLLNMTFNPNEMQYMFYNERTVITFYSPELKTHYYLVLVADRDVDKNLVYVKENESVMQGQRIAYVVFGSQVDLIIEAKEWLRLKKLVNDFSYIFAGTVDLAKVYNNFYNRK